MSLFNALSAPASALQAMQQALGATQQNLLNATTPGYAKQRVSLEARQFDPDRALPGGVSFAMAGDTRSQYAENAVWRQVSAHSQAKEFVQSLSTLEPFLSDGNTGVSGSIRSFFAAATNWSAFPDDTAAREGVLTHAKALTSSFREIGEHLQWMLAQVDHGISGTVSEINGLVTGVRDAGKSALEDASAFASLEELASKAGITARKEADGSFTVALSGAATLLTGSSALQLKVGEDSTILGADGTDLTAQIAGGKLKGLLDARAEIVRLIGDADSEGELNRFARTMAEEVNGIFTDGLVSPGPPPVAGQELFTWDEDHPNAVLRTLTVSPDISAATLPGYSAGPPADAGGTARALAVLGKASAMDGSTLNGFYENLASGVATRLATTKSSVETLAAWVEAAAQYREELSGVSVEQEAVTLLAVQRAYESSAKVIKVIDDMLATTLDLIR